MVEEETMTDLERLNKVARDLRGNRIQLMNKIEASKLELGNDEDLLKNFDVAISALEKAGAAKEEEVSQAPLPFAAGSVTDTAPAAANDGVEGTDANGSPI